MIVLEEYTNSALLLAKESCHGLPGCGGIEWEEQCHWCQIAAVISGLQRDVSFLDRMHAAAAARDGIDREIYEQDLDAWITMNPVRMEMAEKDGREEEENEAADEAACGGE